MGAIHDLFAGLDRAGPGDRQSLEWALARAGLRPGARVLDAGCGTGADTGALLAAGARVTALDAAPAFIARLAERVPGAEAVVGDLRAPPRGPWDLIWSAGAVYTVGIAEALGAWRPLLAPGGRVAFSDLRWTTDTPPEGARAFWRAAGVTFGTAEALEAELAALGWRVLGARWVGRAGWQAYYAPLEAALPETGALAEALRAEIGAWRDWGDSYDYRLVVVEPA